MKDLIRMSVLGIGLLLVAAGCAQTMPAGTTTTTLPSSSGQPVVMTSPLNPVLPPSAVGSCVTTSPVRSRMSIATAARSIALG